MTARVNTFPQFLAMFTARPALAFAFVAIIVVELALLGWGLVDWVRRSPAETNGPKWLWLVLILFVNMIGPIVYLLFGRKRPQIAESAAPAPEADKAAAAVDTLYGKDEAEPK